MLTAHFKKLVCLVIPMWVGLYQDFIKYDHSIKPLMHRLPKDIMDGLEA
jgi:hypothetical protein